MRLKYLFLFFFIFSLANGQVFHICPTLTPTCVCSTFLQAQQTMTATTTPGTVSFDAADTEALTISSNGIQNINFLNKGITITQSTNSVMTFVSGCTIPITIIGGTFFNSNGGNNVLRLASFSAGFSFFLQNMNLISGGGSSGFSDGSVLNAANQAVFDRCLIQTVNGKAINCNALVATTGAIKVTNSILDGTANAGIGYIDTTATSANAIINFDHCTFSNCVSAYIGKSGEAVTNCLFISNTVDRNLTAPSTVTDFVNCQFGTDVSGGVSCIFGATNTNTFCNKSLYLLAPQDAGLNAGISTGLIGSPSYNGIKWVMGLNSIGANAFSLPYCGGFAVGE